MFWIVLFAILIAFSLFRSARKPGIAVGMLICMFGLENFLQTQAAFFVIQGNAVNLAIGVVVLSAACFSLLRQSAGKLKLESIHVYILLLYGLAFLSYFWTDAAQVFSDRWVAAIPYCITFLVLAPILTREEGVLDDGFRWALWIGCPLLFLSAFYCEWGVRGMVMAAPILLNGVIWDETFPLALASLASIVGVLAIAIDLKTPFPTIVRLSIFGVSIYICLLTHSRGQTIALALVAVVAYLATNNSLSLKSLLPTVFGLGGIAYVIYQVSLNVDLWRWNEALVERAVESRFDVWMKLVSKYLSSTVDVWLFGNGANSSFTLIGGYPHNMLVEILYELGILGFGLYLIIFFRVVSAGNSIILKGGTTFSSVRVGYVLLAVLCVNAVLSLKQGSLDSWQPLMFFAICAGQQEIRILGRKAIRFGGRQQSLT